MTLSCTTKTIKSFPCDRPRPATSKPIGGLFYFRPAPMGTHLLAQGNHETPRTIFLLAKKARIINNVDENQRDEIKHDFNHSYTEQQAWGSAFAACWATRMGVLRDLDLSVPAEEIALETSTQVVFQKKYPSLKLTLSKENFTDFMVNHLSAYDYFRRVIYLGKLLPAKKEKPKPPAL